MTSGSSVVTLQFVLDLNIDVAEQQVQAAARTYLDAQRMQIVAVGDPARVGDTIRSVSKTVAKRSMKEGGVVIEERSILNQRGEIVQRGRLTLLVAKRPSA